MSKSDKNQEIMTVTAEINGQSISAMATKSIIVALWHSGNMRVKAIGCLDGVCGSCRILVRRKTSSAVTVELACQTTIEEGMQIIFPLLPEPPQRKYQLSDIKNTQEAKLHFNKIFPEAKQCRHCGGCTSSCPKDINVELGLNLAVEGKFKEAGDHFIKCVMCDACVSACPDNIDPNYAGLYARRVTALFDLKPPNLIKRLEQLHQGNLNVITSEN